MSRATLFWVIVALIDVPPGQPVHHPVDLRNNNAVLVSQCLLSDAAIGVTQAYGPHKIVIQLCEPTALPDVWGAAFAGHVSHIVGVRSKEEMLDIDAQRVVAFRAIVADLNTGRDWPHEHFPTDSVSEKLTFSATFSAQVAIPGTCLSASPENAAGCSWVTQTAGKHRLNRTVSSCQITSAGAEASFAFRCNRWQKIHNLATMKAKAFDSGNILTWHSGPPQQVQV